MSDTRESSRPAIDNLQTIVDQIKELMRAEWERRRRQRGLSWQNEREK